MLPLIIVFALLGVGGWVGYQVYISVAKMSDAASERMGKKNVVFTKDGVKVGVKQIKNENYVDATQSWFVKAWNLGTSQDAGQRCVYGAAFREKDYLRLTTCTARNKNRKRPSFHHKIIQRSKTIGAEVTYITRTFQ